MKKNIEPNNYIFAQKGIATLPTVVALSILILAVGVGITALSLSDSFTATSVSQSSQALLYAEVGARNALMRVVRNKSYSCAATDCYAIDVVPNGCASGDGCARISVSGGIGTAGDPKVVTSKGLVRNKIRRLQVDVVFDSNLHGQIATTSWQELTN